MVHFKRGGEQLGVERPWVSALKNKLETMEVTAGEDYWCPRHSLGK